MAWAPADPADGVGELAGTDALDLLECEGWVDGGWMFFEIVGQVNDIETIAVGAGIRDVARLRRKFGQGRWRKLKGTALVRLEDGSLRKAEIHWYEAHGLGRRGFKIKRILD